MAAGYVVSDQGAIALTAATAKSILGVVAGTNANIKIVEFHVSFDGVTASAVPVLVELMSYDATTTGTRTSVTIQQLRGATRTVQATGFYNYTVEPTNLTKLKGWLVPAFMGSLTIQSPLGRETEQNASAKGLILRCTAPAGVNARGYIEFEEG